MTIHEGTGVVSPDPSAPDGTGDPSDPGGWGARFLAKVDLQLGKISDVADGVGTVADEVRKLRRQARQQPAIVKLSSVFTLNTAAGAQMCQQGGLGAGVLIGGPEVGTEWSIRQIVVGGTTLTAAATGTAWFLVSAAPPNEQSITSVIDNATTLPSIAFYTPGQFYLAPNENLYMIVTGGTNNAQYVASVSYEMSPFVPRDTQISVG
jgi:hypothetical protein